MRNSILYLAIAAIAFTAGLGVNTFGEQFLTETCDLEKISEPIHVELIEAKNVCRMHGSVMNKELLRFDENFSTPEATLFNSHLVGGDNLWPFWHEHTKAVISGFPNGYQHALRKCGPDEPGCKVHEVCPTCRAAELRWVTKAIRKKL